MNDRRTEPGEKRFLSRHVIVDGEEKGLSSVIIDSDGKVTVRPFEEETAATSWTDSAIVIENSTTSPVIKFFATDKIDLI